MKMGMGLLPAAREMLEKHLEANTAALGKSHPDTARTINCLGTAYHALGKYDLAIEQYNQQLWVKAIPKLSGQRAIWKSVNEIKCL